MRLSGEVVAKKIEDWNDKTTGEKKSAWKIYLKAVDPIEGATEISVPQESYEEISESSNVSFDVAIGVRSFGATPRVYVRYLGNLETVKAKKA